MVLRQPERRLEAGARQQVRLLELGEPAFIEPALCRGIFKGSISRQELWIAQECAMDGAPDAGEKVGLAGHGDEAVGLFIQKSLKNADGFVKVARGEERVELGEGVRRGGGVIDVDGVDLARLLGRGRTSHGARQREGQRDADRPAAPASCSPRHGVHPFTESRAARRHNRSRRFRRTGVQL